MGKSAIVVGSGFGGIASALRLRALGYDVSIFEKLDQLGGRARVFKKSGYTFDAGPTVITAPFLFDELFNLFGKKRSDYVNFVKVEPWYRFYFASDNSTFDYSSDLRKTESEISRFEPSDVDGYKKLLVFSKKIFDVGFTELSHTRFDNFFFMIKQIPKLFRLRSYLTVYQLVSSFLKNEKLRQAFSIQPLLLGGNPINTTSIYNLIHYLERKWGVFYSLGGTGALISALGKLMKEEKIKVNLNSNVTGILTEKDNAVGIQLANRKVKCDKIILNTDPAFAYKNLIKSRFNKKWTKKKLKNWTFQWVYLLSILGRRKNIKM